MNILLTGSTGNLGSAIKHKFSDFNAQVYTVSFKDAWNICFNPEKIKCYDFDVLVHAAANTDVEYCEKNLEQCYRDNYLLTEMLAHACYTAGRKFVFISSTGVYGNKSNRPYCEFDEPNPTTHHHRAKLLAEKSVLAISSSNLVLRIGWLFGGDFQLSKNFVARRIEEAKLAKINGQNLSANNDQVGSPTYSIDVAEQIYKYISVDLNGVFNIVNSGVATRFEYVQEIITYAGINVQVIPDRATSFKRCANVSPNESAYMWKSDSIHIDKLRCWKKALYEYIAACKVSL